MEPNKKHQKRRKYDESFKAEVLEMVAHGQAASQVAQNLGISESLIYKWKNKTDRAKQITKGRNETALGDVVAENVQLKSQLRRTEMERDILKKAMAIVSQIS